MASDCAVGACTQGYCIKPLAAACTADSDCISRYCSNMVCTACTSAMQATECASMVCNAGGQCLAATGEFCLANNQCGSNVCVPTGLFGRCM
jgi:hypothetical protein